MREAVARRRGLWTVGTTLRNRKLSLVIGALLCACGPFYPLGMSAAESLRDRLDGRYAVYRPGEYLVCTLEGGKMDFYPSWKAYKPVRFSITRDETKELELEAAGGRSWERGSMWVWFYSNGTELWLCPQNPRVRRNKCAIQNVRADELVKGDSRSFDVDEHLSGAMLNCVDPRRR